MPMLSNRFDQYRYWGLAFICFVFAALKIPFFLEAKTSIGPWVFSMAYLAAGFAYLPGHFKSHWPLTSVLLLSVLDLVLQGSSYASLQLHVTLLLGIVHVACFVSRRWLFALMLMEMCASLAVMGLSLISPFEAITLLVLLISVTSARYLFDKIHDDERSIHALKMNENSLNDQLAVILRAANFQMLDIDWQRNLVQCSPALSLYLGEKAETPDAAFAWWRACLESDERQHFENTVSRSVTSREPISTRLQINVTGFKQAFKTTVAAYPDSQHLPLKRIIITLQDQQVEVEAQSRYQRAEVIIRSIREACDVRFVWGSIRRKDALWVKLEGPCKELFGIDADGWLRQPALTNGGWEKMSDNDNSRLKFALTAGQSILFTNRYVVPHTQEVLSIACCLCQDISHPEFMDCVLIDVTAMNNRDKRIAQLNDSLKIAETATADFLSSVNHELMTPMNSLASYIQVAFANSEDSNVRTQLAAAMHSVRRLKTMLNDTVSMGEIHLVHLRPEHKTFSLGQMIRGLQKSVDVRLDGRQVVFNLQLDTRLPDSVVGDAVRIKQILMRVLTYATVFTRRGKVSLVIRQGAVDFQRGMIDVVFEIKDNTRGIAKESLRRLMQTGLDDKLPIVENFKHDQSMTLVLAKQHTHYLNGQFSVDSILGVGNTFEITFPLEAVRSLDVRKAAEVFEDVEVAEDEPIISDPKTRLENVKILIVDDNPLNNESLKLLLELEGADVTDILLPSKALLTLQSSKNHFAVIVLDVQMPEMDGFELATHIRALPDYKEVPIIFISANFDKSLQDKCLAVGGNFLLTKPFNRDHLIEPMRDLLAGEDISLTPIFHDTDDQSLDIGDSGLDVDGALENLGGNLSIFNNMVKRFVDRISGDAKEFEELMLRGDAKLAASKAHFIAGGAAIIGATGLASWLKEYENRALSEKALLLVDQDLTAFRRLNDATLKAAQRVLDQA